MVYPQWSPISCRSSAGQGKFAGSRYTEGYKLQFNKIFGYSRSSSAVYERLLFARKNYGITSDVACLSLLELTYIEIFKLHLMSRDLPAAAELLLSVYMSVLYARKERVTGHGRLSLLSLVHCHKHCGFCCPSGRCSIILCFIMSYHHTFVYSEVVKRNSYKTHA